jgi:hypothetical protein
MANIHELPTFMDRQNCRSTNAAQPVSAASMALNEWDLAYNNNEKNALISMQNVDHP